MTRHRIIIGIMLGCLVSIMTADGQVLQKPEDYSVDFGSSIDTGGSLQEVISEADTVVQVKALSSSMRYGAPLDPELLPHRRFVLRDYHFQLIRTFKGAHPLELPIKVSVIGGKSIDGVPMPLGSPAFVEGREYVLLLCKITSDDAFWLTRGLSSAFDITDSRVQPLGNSVSARSQRNVEHDRFLQRIAAYAKRKGTPKQMGYACGWD